MSFTQTVYQIVFSTKYREKTLLKNNREELYKYMCGILKNKRCIPYQIGGVEDHIHIVTSLHSTVPLADLVKDVKVASNKYIKQENLFPHFSRWQNEYGAFTYSKKALPNLIDYVRNQ